MKAISQLTTQSTMLQAQVDQFTQVLVETAQNSESKQLANAVFKSMKSSFEEIRKLI